jgi:hypothetical protein
MAQAKLNRFFMPGLPQVLNNWRRCYLPTLNYCPDSVLHAEGPPLQARVSTAQPLSPEKERMTRHTRFIPLFQGKPLLI